MTVPPAASAGDGLPALALELKGLRKVYAGNGRQPPKEALKGIDLAVPRGSIFGLLGPNGAGKSTLINILAGLVIKTAGTARIWGIDIDVNPRRARRAIGVVPQELNLDAFFTPREALELQAGLYGVPEGASGAPTRSWPRSASPTRPTPMPARSRAACGGGCWSPRRWSTARRSLILDEPTAGVDVELRRSSGATCASSTRAGVTVVLTTHYLEEAEADVRPHRDHQPRQVVACDEQGRAAPAGSTRRSWSSPPAEPCTALPPGLASWAPTSTPRGRITVRYRPSRARVGEISTPSAPPA